MVKLDNELGKILPVVGIQHNPTYEWFDVVYRFRIDQKEAHLEPHYGNTKIHAVLMTGGELENPNTNIAFMYNHLRWPNDSTVLNVVELEDGSLWESMTSNTPMSIDPGTSIISGRSWKDDFILSSAARKCEKLIGPHVKKLHFLCPLTDRGRELHESRFTKHNKK